ncbi:hypothetical protein GobsT_40890 [Gemmata obscuriglobus]|uniref:Uncharacterized protein n=1 Tax=Gemmata obscuriglobus TaxID=114 RepID=A0A2Z3GTY7_9BACT|nr:hypothetical protein [Gemmata obscuriglobus]AWM37869.1 hypothetical protein C1280_13255 [Gemmata obscuriglobus]QEG29294.1 hypothetical protein GobsT_40890 [Gemmata obscuriglobus]VTS08259.1 unnamed protein product [Gemmata obscuriglobus UQM 2246]
MFVEKPVPTVQPAQYHQDPPMPFKLVWSRESVLWENRMLALVLVGCILFVYVLLGMTMLKEGPLYFLK